MREGGRFDMEETVTDGKDAGFENRSDVTVNHRTPAAAKTGRGKERILP